AFGGRHGLADDAAFAGDVESVGVERQRATRVGAGEGRRRLAEVEQDERLDERELLWCQGPEDAGGAAVERTHEARLQVGAAGCGARLPRGAGPRLVHE